MADDHSLFVHVEVCQKSESSLDAGEIERELENYLMQQEDLILHKLLYDTVLPVHINYIRVCSNCEEKYKVNFLTEKVSKEYHIYQTWNEGPQVDTMDEESDGVPTSLNWCLPNVSFEGLWETLILEDGIKEQLMTYVQTILLYSSKNVNNQVIHWNGVVLLHGPPGTGKTTLCKALAQKLSIRLNSKYKTSQLIEINTHSLFSKWFSESAKLVLKMFTLVRQWLELNDNFVCILIDEVESLTHVRQAKGTEPSDSIRVVNAVLTQIDQLQKYPNVLILATSNVTNIIDLAFADRADLKLLVTYPAKWGVYEILRSCVEEVIKCGLVEGNVNDLFEAVIFRKLTSNQSKEGDGDAMTEIMEKSKKLMHVSELCDGLSGRTLRKVPFLTSTKFINKPKPSVELFLEVMKQVTARHIEDNNKFFKH